MKKQTKVMATLSTAALLALGFSAVSMAAGWDISTGAWRYLKNDGTEVTDEWKSANGNWFYLDDDGVMATDKLIEDESNSKTKYYYVDQYGAMVKNTWKAVAMDDDENTDLDAEYWWYYFGNDGKALTSTDTLTKSDIKTINGLKYAFNERGHMLYGWIDADSPDQADDDETHWQNSEYYFNGWNDGHASTGWQQLTVEDNGETKDYWFYFDNDGKKTTNKRKKINGVYYHFGEHGNMVDEWVDGTNSGLTANASGSDLKDVAYLNGDGSERKNQWVWAVPDGDWLKGDNDDDSYSWFYFDKSGKIVVDQMKKINGKKYAFDRFGRMLSGLVVDNGEFAKPEAVDGENGKGASDYTREKWINFAKALPTTDKIYYFSDNAEKDGSMKKGYVNIELDEDTYQFYFNTKTGEGLTGWNTTAKKILVGGLVIKPNSDDESNYAGVDYDKSLGSYTLSFGTDISEGDTLVNKSGTVVKGSKDGKAIKDENDAYIIVTTDETGDNDAEKNVVAGVFADKEAYDKARKAVSDKKVANLVEAVQHPEKY